MPAVIKSSAPSKLPRGPAKWRRNVLCAVLTGALAGVVDFENAMDLWMFGNISFLARLWFLFHEVPDAYVIKECDDLSSAFESNVPVLFKQCIPAKLTSLDFAFLPNSRQNLFPACDGQLTRISNSFVAKDGSRSSLVEVVPCSNSTLSQKMERFWMPTSEEDNAYSDSHVYMMDEAELAHVAQGLEASGVVPTGFEFRGSTATMIHLFARGFSSVGYFHSHLDRVFSFGMGKREWHVINPKHHSKFDRQWSLNGGVMAIREKAEAPQLRVVQERGDIFVLPPWWMHKTVPVDSTREKGVNFNIHTTAEGQIVGKAANLLHRLGLQRVVLQ